MRLLWCKGVHEESGHVGSHGGIPREWLDVGASALVVGCQGERHATRRCGWTVSFSGKSLFNGVLLNRYRTGKDSVSWHSDDESEFGHNPVIASASFGATRSFQFRHRKNKELRTSIELTHGSLLVMRGGTQENWVHQVPKTARSVEERLNLTFRRIIAPAG